GRDEPPMSPHLPAAPTRPSRPGNGAGIRGRCRCPTIWPMGLTSLSGGTVVTSLSPPAVVRADVTIEDGRVRAVERWSPPDAHRVSCEGMVVMPGLVCAHHHLYSTLARGMPSTLEPPADFLEILRRVWWRLDRALDIRGVFCSARVGAIEALAAGTTTVI